MLLLFFQPFYVSRAPNTGIQQADLFYSAGYTGTSVSQSQRRKKIGRGLEKNAGEWTGRVEINKDEISGSKRSMYGYILTYSRL